MSAQNSPEPWPKHADGRPMRLGEMTPEQRRERAKLAIQRVAKEIEANAPAITKVVDEFDKAGRSDQ